MAFLKRGSGIAIYMPTFRGQHILPNLLKLGPIQSCPAACCPGYLAHTTPTKYQPGQADEQPCAPAQEIQQFFCWAGLRRCLSTAMLSTVLESVHVH